jgi:hypothetical protein
LPCYRNQRELNSEEVRLNDSSLYRLGSIAAIVLGLCYLVSGIASAITPAAVAGVPDVQLPIMYFEQNKFLILTNWWAQLIGALFALAVIPAISTTVQHLNEGWVRWTGTLATIAFAVVILDNYWSIVYTDALAKLYATGTAAVREAMSIPGAAQWIDVKGWLAFGAVGLWLLVVSLLALRGNSWPKGLANLGILGALFISSCWPSTSWEPWLPQVSSCSLELPAVSSLPFSLRGWDFSCVVHPPLR